MKLPRNTDEKVIQIKAEWEKIYKNRFGKKIDFSDLVIPESYDPSEYFGVIVAQGITLNEVKSKNHNVACYLEDLDDSIVTNGRVPDKNYFVMFRRQHHADSEIKGLSASELIRIRVKGITLLERLLLQEITNHRLDNDSDCDNLKTLCFGSRDADGRVPVVYWFSDSYNKLMFPGYDNSGTRIESVGHNETVESIRGRVAYL